MASQVAAGVDREILREGLDTFDDVATDIVELIDAGDYYLDRAEALQAV